MPCVGVAAFTEAGNATEFPAPNLDSGDVVYAGALALLDEAEALLEEVMCLDHAADVRARLDNFLSGHGMEKFIHAPVA